MIFYFKRKKRALGQATDVFIYDAIPEGLRTQVVYIWGDGVGVPNRHVHEIEETYGMIVDALRREYSTFRLHKASRNGPHEELVNWFLTEKDADKVLDAIELSFAMIEGRCSRIGYAGRYLEQVLTIGPQAIEELNARFREAGVGYQYSDGQIVCVDSQLIHKDVVVPALTVLRGKSFKNAQDEFLSAYEHFRHGKKQEALVDCYKCFESTMKVICTERKWQFDPKAAAKDLVNVCLSNGLIPAYWQNHLSGVSPR